MKKTNTLEVDFETALEWYLSEDAFKQSLALQCFDREDFEKYLLLNKIITIDDVVEALGMDKKDVEQSCIKLSNMPNGKQLRAIYLLNLVRTAFNKEWEPSIDKGVVYYPLLKLFIEGDEPQDVTPLFRIKDNKNGKTYVMIMANVIHINKGMMSSYKNVCTLSEAGLICCKSAEIAQHLCKNFGHLIFDALYGQYDFDVID